MKSKHIFYETESNRLRNVYRRVPYINAIKIRIYDNKTGEKKGTITISVGDFELCKDYVWTLNADNYAQSFDGETTILLHRLITNAPDDIQVDHINGNPLNNRRENLRLVDQSEQMKNRSKFKTEHPINSKSPVPGVHWTGSRWRVQITSNGHCIPGGSFDNLIDATAKRIELEEKFHKSFARDKSDMVEWIKQHRA